MRGQRTSATSQGGSAAEAPISTPSYARSASSAVERIPGQSIPAAIVGRDQVVVFTLNNIQLALNCILKGSRRRATAVRRTDRTEMPPANSRVDRTRRRQRDSSRNKATKPACSKSRS